jgi:hypothetical protein
VPGDGVSGRPEAREAETGNPRIPCQPVPISGNSRDRRTARPDHPHNLTAANLPHCGGHLDRHALRPTKRGGLTNGQQPKIMRALWRGETVTREGPIRVDEARVYSCRE